MLVDGTEGSHTPDPLGKTKFRTRRTRGREGTTDTAHDGTRGTPRQDGKTWCAAMRLTLRTYVSSDAQ